jgi:hypothetical protein
MESIRKLIGNRTEPLSQDPRKDWEKAKQKKLSDADLQAKYNFEHRAEIKAKEERKKRAEKDRKEALKRKLDQERAILKQKQAREKAVQKAKSDAKRAERKQILTKNYAQANKSIAFKPVVVGITSFLGLILYFLLPNAFKIFAFLVPAIAISWGCSSRFNFPLLLMMGLVFLLFPTSIFTLDASNSFNWDLIAIENYVENVANVISGVVFVGLPIVCVLGAIYAFSIGNVEGAVSSITKVIIIIVMTSVFLFIADKFNIPLIGNLEAINSIGDFVWSVVQGIGNGAGNIINKVDIFDVAPDVPEIPDASLILDATHPETFRLTIIGSYPINLCLVGIAISILALLFKKPLPKLDFDQSNDLSRPYQINYEFLIYLCFILVCYFLLYLWLGETGFLTYRSLGYFTIYLTIISVSCLALAFGLGSIAKVNWNSILGIIYGIFALYLTFNLFTQQTTLELLSFESKPEQITSYNIIAQGIAVAPAESFLFHVFIPSLCLYILFLSVKRYNNKTIDQEIAQNRVRIEKLQLENQYYQVQLLKPKLSSEVTTLLKEKDLGDTNDYLYRIAEIQKLSNKINAMQVEKQKTIQFHSNQLSLSQKITFYAVCIVSNIIFSLMHWFNSGLDIRLFWVCGLGLIYLLSGLILTFISFRYGWLAGIIAHAINNSTGLIILMLSNAI